MTTPSQTESIAKAHERLDAHDQRIIKLETHTAVEAVRSQHIQGSLADIKSGITWITRLVIGGIVAGIVAFALSGGFSVH